MKKLLTIFLALLLLANASAQDSSFLFLRNYQGDVAGAALDNLQNLYVLSSGGQIRKFTSNGDSAALYNQVRNFGKLYSIDVSNPLKPVLFYKDFSTVVILDRFLANRTTLDLRRLNILQPGAVALSYDNQLWVFDELESKLKKVDESGNLLLETIDFRTVFSETIKPQRIIDDNGMVYLADSARGVYIFDNYGTFKKRVPLRGWQHLAVKEQVILYTLNDAIFLYNTKTFIEARLPIPSSLKPYQGLISSFNRLVTHDKEGLKVYLLRVEKK